eukprot:SAG11_NODE_4740_length_1784_cov_0.973887_2_plen_254_part_00
MLPCRAQEKCLLYFKEPKDFLFFVQGQGQVQPRGAIPLAGASITVSAPKQAKAKGKGKGEGAVVAGMRGDGGGDLPSGEGLGVRGDGADRPEGKSQVSSPAMAQPAAVGRPAFGAADAGPGAEGRRARCLRSASLSCTRTSTTASAPSLCAPSRYAWHALARLCSPRTPTCWANGGATHRALPPQGADARDWVEEIRIAAEELERQVDSAFFRRMPKVRTTPVSFDRAKPWVSGRGQPRFALPTLQPPVAPGP